MSPVPFYLLRRYLLPHEGNLLTLALWVSVAGVALGILQLVVVLSVMSGFQEFLQKSYTRISSEMVVIPRSEALPDPNLPAEIASVKGIEAISAFAIGQAMVIKDGVGGVNLEGIDLEASSRVVPWNEIWESPVDLAAQKAQTQWIWVGTQLAKKLGLKLGDQVNLFFPGSKHKIAPFTVTGITRFGIYEHDLRSAHIDLKVLKSLLPLESMYRVKLREGEDLETVARRTKAAMGDRAGIKLWRDLNQNFFRAVAHQKLSLFIILQIVIALAAMNVVNLLMMSSYHRRRDVAILRAMGMRFGEVFFFFVAQGAAVGMIGIVAGIGLGYGASILLSHWQPVKLSESIYNVSRLPIRVELHDVGLIAVAAFGLCVVFSVLPALRAATARPVKALRYE